MDENAFKTALSTAQIPVLVLDQKWHRLFAISGKPKEVAECEKKLRDLLALQGKVNTDLKNLKKLKAQLMQDIMENMGDDNTPKSPEVQKKMDEDKRLIDEANHKTEELEDQLLELPAEIKKINNELMLLTMSFCYSKLRTNQDEVNEISDWIDRFRVELKKNIIRKQNREINNREIYAYMHDIFGKDVINLFDMRFDEIEAQEKKERELEAEKKKSEGTTD